MHPFKGLIKVVKSYLREREREEKCEKLIEYQTNTYKFKSLSGKIPGGIEVGVGGIDRETKKLETACIVSMGLDNLQYVACRMSKALAKGSKRWNENYDFRLGALGLITAVMTAIEAYKADPKRQAKNLDSIVRQMNEFVVSNSKRATAPKRGISKWLRGGPDVDVSPTPYTEEEHILAIDPTATSRTLEFLGEIEKL